MLSDLNLDVDDDNGAKDRFLPLEIREMLSNWNILDKNVDSISEDMKDKMIVNLHKMIEDLETQLNERIRWAIKTMVQSRRRLKDDSAELIKLRKWKEETGPIKNLEEEILLMEAKLSSVVTQFPNADKENNMSMRGKKRMKAEKLASKLPNSETRNRLENQKVKLQGLHEKMKIEKQKTSEMEKLVHTQTMVAAILFLLEMQEISKERDSAIERLAAEMSLKESELKSLMKTHRQNCAGDEEKLGKSNWKCIICKKYKDERIIFLPCVHQVMCMHCNDDDVNKGNTRCPCCDGLIKNRISDILSFACMNRL